ncbi:MAG: TetR/AcrR family transcriptional regulator [Paracoccaceae bacterium]|nr:MAG: TetR/AcrR family transcriptional regulator [Paracoccaceae bacterium]
MTATAAPDAPAPPDAARTRLSRDDWTQAGLRALVAEGPAGLRVEAIARGLGATKGSFYWHFRDAPDLRAAVLAAWESMAAADLAATLGQPDAPPRKRVMLLVDLVSAEPGGETDGQAVEPAVRDWARIDPEARGVLARVDAGRQAALREALAGAGLGAAAAARGGAAVYAAMIGFAHLRLTSGAEVRRDLAALVRAVLDGRL